jgi:hypothetical protein
MRRLPLLLACACVAIATSARAATPTVRVHLAGGPDVTLLREDPCTRERTIVCHAPCDRDVPSTGLFQIRGESFRPTEPFELAPDADGKVWLEVNGAPKSTYYVGVAATSVGVSFTIVGFGVVISGMAIPTRTRRTRGRGWAGT